MHQQNRGDQELLIIINYYYYYKGGKFLEKLWCGISGGITR